MHVSFYIEQKIFDMTFGFHNREELGWRLIVSLNNLLYSLMLQIYRWCSFFSIILATRTTTTAWQSDRTSTFSELSYLYCIKSTPEMVRTIMLWNTKLFWSAGKPRINEITRKIATPWTCGTPKLNEQNNCTGFLEKITCNSMIKCFTSSCHG